MKKVYTKPEIIFESFSLSTNIAGDCESIIDTQSRGNCGIEFGNLVIFVGEYTGCNSNDGVIVEGDDGNYNGICYHVPVESSTLFNS